MTVSYSVPMAEMGSTVIKIAAINKNDNVFFIITPPSIDCPVHYIALPQKYQHFSTLFLYIYALLLVQITIRQNYSSYIGGYILPIGTKKGLLQNEIVQQTLLFYFIAGKLIPPKPPKP